MAKLVTAKPLYHFAPYLKLKIRIKKAHFVFYKKKSIFMKSRVIWDRKIIQNAEPKLFFDPKLLEFSKKNRFFYKRRNVRILTLILSFKYGAKR